MGELPAVIVSNTQDNINVNAYQNDWMLAGASMELHNSFMK